MRKLVAVIASFTMMGWGIQGVCFGNTVNFDFQRVGDVTYSGDNAILSFAGGTHWNSVTMDGLGGPLLDQFGHPVFWTITQDSEIFEATTSIDTNTLQDSGLFSGMLIRGLELRPYDYAVYVADRTFVGVEHSEGETAHNSWYATGNLPGVQVNDYVRSSSPVIPFEYAPGDYALAFGYEGRLDGAITGLQLRPSSGTTKEPMARTEWEFYNPTGTNSSGSHSHSSNAGHIEELNMPTVPPTRFYSEATSGLNPFGGGSIGAVAEVRRVGVRGEPPPAHGFSRTTAEFVSVFQADGATIPFDLDLYLTIDGLMSILGIETASIIPSVASVDVVAKVSSNMRDEITLFDGYVAFFGDEDSVFLDRDTQYWENGDQYTYTELTNDGVHVGGNLEVFYEQFFNDIFIAVPGEQIALEFKIVVMASAELHDTDIEYVLSDFLHTMTGLPSTDTPGITFVAVIPEPGLALVLPMSMLALRRRSNRR